MSKIFCFSLLFAFLSHAAVAQDLTFDSLTMKYIYREIVDMDSMSMSKIYDRASQWLALAYNDTKVSTRYDDKASGVMIAKGFWPHDFGGGYWHTLKIECKDGRYRATFTDFVIKSDFGGQKYEGPAEKAHKKDRQKFAKRSKEALDSLRQKMKQKEDGW